MVNNKKTKTIIFMLVTGWMVSYGYRYKITTSNINWWSATTESYVLLNSSEPKLETGTYVENNLRK